MKSIDDKNHVHFDIGKEGILHFADDRLDIVDSLTFHEVITTFHTVRMSGCNSNAGGGSLVLFPFKP